MAEPKPGGGVGGLAGSLAMANPIGAGIGMGAQLLQSWLANRAAQGAERREEARGISERQNDMIERAASTQAFEQPSKIMELLQSRAAASGIGQRRSEQTVGDMSPYNPQGGQEYSGRTFDPTERDPGLAAILNSLRSSETSGFRESQDGQSIVYDPVGIYGLPGYTTTMKEGKKERTLYGPGGSYDVTAGVRGTADEAGPRGGSRQMPSGRGGNVTSRGSIEDIISSLRSS